MTNLPKLRNARRATRSTALRSLDAITWARFALRFLRWRGKK
jgi:hypothetical protein